MTTKNPTSPEIQDVLLFQTVIAIAQSSVEQLSQAIDAQRKKIEALRHEAAEIDALVLQREDLLADIAIGQDKSAELQKMDELLAQRKKAFADQSMQDMEQTMAGLTRKLEVTRAELKKLQDKRSPLLCAMLLAQANELGAEYVIAAKRLVGLHERITATLQLYVANGGHAYIGRSLALDIPVFQVDSVLSHALFIQKNHIAFGVKNHSDFLAGIRNEVDLLRAAGVDID